VRDLLAALGALLVLEGVLYAAFPTAMRDAMARLLALPEPTVRTLGLAAALTGLAIVWAVRG
jgi:uncharacterized protein YjeT (DUF2065 family)